MTDDLDPTNGRDQRGRFAAGNLGRPRGAKNLATRAAEQLLAGEAEELSRAMVSKALEGDTTALKYCLDRILPRRQDEPITFELGSIQTAEELLAAGQTVLTAVAKGELTPIEAQRVMDLIETVRRTLEQVDLSERLNRLELALQEFKDRE